MDRPASGGFRRLISQGVEKVPMLNLSSSQLMQLAARFEELRQTLSQPERSSLWEKRLGFWATAADRNLPLPVITKTLREIVSSDLRSIAATPGIGQKKLGGLLMLLERAVATNPAMLPQMEAAAQLEEEGQKKIADFDLSQINEVVWSEWRDTVRRHRLETLPLGRLVSSLRSVPRVMWEVPLGEFAGLSLNELFARRAFGEKRLRAVWEVFRTVHQTLHGVEPDAAVGFTLAIRRVVNIQNWILETWQSGEIPSAEQLRERFVLPIFEQLRQDCVPQAVDLAEQRIGIHDAPRSVQRLAREFHLTRARIYQLFDDQASALRVRWPVGRGFSQVLYGFIEYESQRRMMPYDLTQLGVMLEVLFARPGARREIVTANRPTGLAPGFAQGQALDHLNLSDEVDLELDPEAVNDVVTTGHHTQTI